MINLTILGIEQPVGWRMAERASARGWRVCGLAASPEGRRRAERSFAHVLEGELDRGRALERVVEQADVVVHAAELVDGESSARLHQVNVLGARAAARAASAASVRHFIHLSTGRVYGRACADGVTEAGPFACEGDPYAHSKLRSEVEVWPQHRPGGMAVTVLRPGHVYGPHSAEVLEQTVRSLRRGAGALVHGGQRVMNHLHIDNLIDVIEIVIQRRVVGEVLNVTDGESTTEREYYECFARAKRLSGLPPRWYTSVARGLLGSVVQRSDASLPPALAVREPVGGRYDITRMRLRLGYAPRIGLADGMRALGCGETGVPAVAAAENSAASSSVIACGET